jgi:hypothetical protein
MFGVCLDVDELEKYDSVWIKTGHRSEFAANVGLRTTQRVPTEEQKETGVAFLRGQRPVCSCATPANQYVAGVVCSR